MAAVGAGLAIPVLIGAMAGSLTWVAAVVTGLVAGIASFVCQAAELPPPRELMLIMALLAATAVPAGLAGAAQRAGLAAAGAAFAWLVTMSPALSRSRRRLPERRAVTGALAAVAAFLDTAGTDQAPAARHTAVESVRRARTTVAQGDVPPGDPLARAVIATEALLEATLHLEVEAPGRLRPDWGIAVRALIPAVTGGQVPATPPPCASGAPPAAVPLLQAIEDARADLSRHDPVLTERAALGGWPGLVPQIAAALQGSLAVLRAVDADAAADTGLASRSTDAAWPVSAGIEELARLALSWPAYRTRPEPAQAAELRHHLEELASATTEARPPDTTIPALPGSRSPRPRPRP